MVEITLPDGSKKKYKKVTGKEIAASIGERLAKDALAIKVDDAVLDLDREITKDTSVRILTFNDGEGKQVFWHSSAHVLANAVVQLWPKAKLTIGPPIENGFYYDFAKKEPFTPEDLKKIEEKMREIIKQDLSFEREEITVAQAKKLFKDNKYKLELIEDKKVKTLSVYKNKKFVDLCSGPHVPSTGYLKNIKLIKTSAAYWKGDEKRESLQRVYGVSFPDKKELKKYLELLEEAEKRDHRKLGKQLGLWVFSELIGPGMPLYTPKGNILRDNIITYSRYLNNKAGYKEVHTPNMNKATLFKTSGHYEKFKEDMLQVVSHYTDEEYFLKPMNCPQHTQIYASEARSYKDLPVRYSDFANLYRDEKTGELAGLSRLRCFAQDDGHSFCTPEQIEEEFTRVLDVVNEALKTYKLEFWIRLSLRDPNNKKAYLGDDKVWEESQNILRELLQKKKINFKEAEGEAAFYGPKMDIMVKDALQREWQISTIQIDFNMPARFKLVYNDKDGKEKTPVMIHRAIVGSPERFMSIFLEHCGGKLPLWMNPNQVIILAVADRFAEYAEKIACSYMEEGIHVDVDASKETIGKKVRNAQLKQYNYILVVGEKEVKDNTVTVRTRDGNVEGAVKSDAFSKRVVQEIQEKK
tara:strand:+ start:784 stop:2697 length:1914 start_codon:yes stop_codon:yes gene_type:complete